MDTIQRKILEKVANLTTHKDFLDDDDTEANTTDGVDADIVLTTGSDADSSGDSKVVANSIDGEDELVVCLVVIRQYETTFAARQLRLLPDS